MFTRPAPRAARRRWLSLLPALLLTAVARAGAADTLTSPQSTAPTAPVVAKEKAPALDTLDIETSYVGNATFREKEFGGLIRPEQGYGSFDETQLSVDYAHRFQLFGKVYLKVGAGYERFDFGTTRAPLPSSLQSITGTVALEYIEQGEVGAFLTTSPGVFYSDLNSVGLGNFDAPTAAGVILPLGKKFYFLLGARVSVLSKYPVFPVVGAIWLITDKLRLEARPPTPRLIYSYSKQLDFYVGAELLGSAYKRDADRSARPQDRRFNNTVVDFSETRVGGGIVVSPTEKIDIELDGGCSVDRDFEYYRGDSKTLRAHPAAYARISVSASF